MKKFVKLLALFAVLVTLTGCASIVGGAGPQVIPVYSNPQDAKLEVTDLKTGMQILNTQTPYTMMLNRSSGYFSRSQYKIKISKDGYLPLEQVITPRVSGWYIGGNIVFGGLLGWLIVDPGTGAMYTFDEKFLTYSLYADNEVGRAAFQAEIDKKAEEDAKKKAAIAEVEKYSVQSYNPAFDR